MADVAQTALSTAGDADAGTPARLAASYGGILRRVFAWAFLPVSVPASAGAHLRSLSQQGTVVYVGRSAALVTFLYFQHLFVRLGAPVAKAVEGLSVGIWHSSYRVLAGRKSVRAPEGGDVVAAAKAGHSAMVFLRRPGTLAGQMVQKGDPFPGLVAAQRQIDRPIYLVPQLLIWERRPRHLQRNLFDVVFGEVESPGFFRSLFALLWNRKRAFVKFGEPIDLKKVVADFAKLDDATIARKVRGSLHQHLARETRVVTGPPIKSPDRLIEETLRDRSLRATLAEVARDRGRADGSVEREAEKALREIAARYSPRTIEYLKWVLDLIFTRGWWSVFTGVYEGIDADQEGLARIATAAKKMPIVVCPGHKSHIDYLVLSYLFHISGMTTPHIAAGINLDFPPVGTILRKGGGFFIRRSFKGDKVYGAVLKAYVRMLVRDGFFQEFFVEGGRSRTGKVLPPKFGILSMEVEAWLDGARPDIAFVPTSISYERILEGKSYARELAGGEKKAENLGQLVHVRKMLGGNYGRIHIRFDEPLSLAEIARQRGVDPRNCSEEQKRGLVRALGFRIVEGINRATALTPSALLASALLSHDRRGLTATELADRMRFLLNLAVDSGARLTFADEPNALDPLGTGAMHAAFVAAEREKQVVVHKADSEAIFSVPDQHRVPLDFYKNSSIHFFVAEALLATGILITPSGERTEIYGATLALSRLLKQEFIYGAGGFATLFNRRVTQFAKFGMVHEEGNRLVVTESGTAHVRLLADLLVNFVEAYESAAASLTVLLKGPLDRKELIRQGMEKTRSAFLAGNLRRFEAISRVTLENALQALEEEGVLVSTGERGKQRALAPGWQSQQSIDARVTEIKRFLVPRDA